MFNFITKNFPNVCAGLVIIATFFIFIFQLVSINASRDVKSANIRRIERECAKLETEIKDLQAKKERLCNTEILRANSGLPEDFKEIPNEDIIRVRTRSVPYGASRSRTSNAKDVAVELNELAIISKR